LRVLLAELPLKQSVALAVKLTGEKKNMVYDMALAIKAAPDAAAPAAHDTQAREESA
jgi:16S rRNA (cytidine1402-2'-O)-methyltransferase